MAKNTGLVFLDEIKDPGGVWNSRQAWHILFKSGMAVDLKGFYTVF